MLIVFVDPNGKKNTTGQFCHSLGSSRSPPMHSTSDERHHVNNTCIHLELLSRARNFDGIGVGMVMKALAVAKKVKSKIKKDVKDEKEVKVEEIKTEGVMKRPAGETEEQVSAVAPVPEGVVVMDEAYNGMSLDEKSRHTGRTWRTKMKVQWARPT